MRLICARAGRWLAEPDSSILRAMDKSLDTERQLRDLSEFLRIPSISTLPAYDADCRRAAEWVAAELRSLGCREVSFLGSDTHPRSEERRVGKECRSRWSPYH